MARLATETTLGADNGVAIAAMMALVDEGAPHGPLELLMTVAEEVGLEGANALDGSLLTGSVLLNLDGGEQGRLIVGCAGSTDTCTLLDAPPEVADYGGWRPRLDSPTLASARVVYEELFGEPAIVAAVHAGIEPAAIGGKVPGLDMLSFGPQIELPHSPDERLSVSSVGRFWALLVALVDQLSAGDPPTPGRESRESLA